MSTGTANLSLATADIPQDARHRATHVNVAPLERIASAFGGAGLVAHGLSRGSWTGLGLAAIGGGLLYRAFSGHCATYAAIGVDTAGLYAAGKGLSSVSNGIKVDRSITVARPVEELYRLWRDIERLPTIMRHLKSVEDTGGKRSHWTTAGPLGTCVEWDAEVFNERENELIAWRSLENSDIGTAGSVRFKRVPGGTEIHVQLSYDVPGGWAGSALASLFGESPEKQVDDDLRQFKEYVESPLSGGGTFPKTAK
jgi:uncharacterized membrane protein